MYGVAVIGGGLGTERAKELKGYTSLLDTKYIGLSLNRAAPKAGESYEPVYSGAMFSIVRS